MGGLRMKKLYGVLLLLSSTTIIFGWGKSGYKQVVNEGEYPLTQSFVPRMNLSVTDKKFLQAVEDGDIETVKQQLNNNSFGSNVLFVANNIAQQTNNTEMSKLITAALNKRFIKRS